MYKNLWVLLWMITEILILNYFISYILNQLGFRNIGNTILTTTPHPHLTGNWAIPVNDENRDMIQAKAC